MTVLAISTDRLAMVRLAQVEGLGPVKLRRLIDAFGSAEGVLAASRADLEAVDGIGPRLARAVLDPEAEERAKRRLALLAGAGVRVLFPDDDEFPPGLREIYDGPVFLTVRGALLPRDRAAVAIVGSRRCTRYGIDQAERFAYALAARGVTIVSGLARGIDAAAHRGALQAGGRTIAVLASGLGNIYPPEHEELAAEVARSGALLSEAPLDGPPLAGLFPLRNRLISGISLGVLVVEAAARSGALSTAHHAVEQNRDVFAIPGRLGDPASEGTNRLIQKGAMLVVRPEDVLEALGPFEMPQTLPPSDVPSTPDDAPPADLNEVERKLWAAVGRDEVPLDMLIDRTGLSPSEASATLFMLELRRRVERLPGNAYRRVRSND
jgi:DNA processing protein